MVKLKAFREMYTEEEIQKMIGETESDFGHEIDFESFLKVSHLMSSYFSLVWWSFFLS